GAARKNGSAGFGGGTLMTRTAGGSFDAKKSCDWKANVFRIEVFGRFVTRMPATDGDEWHGQAIGVVVVLQALDLVIADEFQAIDVFGMPARAVHADLKGASVVGRGDGSRNARPQLALLADQPDHAFQ